MENSTKKQTKFCKNCGIQLGKYKQLFCSDKCQCTLYNATHKEYRTEKMREWYKKNSTYLRDQSRKWRKKHPEQHREYQSNYQRMLKFGIGNDQVNVIRAKQKNRCAICGVEAQSLKRDLHVDHNHTTGIVRGLLCSACNAGIGQLRDNPWLIRKAADYVEMCDSGLTDEFADDIMRFPSVQLYGKVRKDSPTSTS